VNDILFLILLLVLSGIFSGSETALVTLTLARAQALMGEGRRGAHALVRLKSDPSRMLITILIGNNIVNIAASAIATVVATQWFGDIGPGIAVGVLTILILIFGEITPKSLATRYAERISLFIAPPMFGLMRLLTPAVWLFSKLTTKVQRMTGSAADPIVTENELISLAEHGEEEGTIESDEREMIERVFILNDLKAADVMTPRGDVYALNGSRSLKEVMADITVQPYSRVPLYDKDPTDILKILYMRDVLEALVQNESDVRLQDIAHDPLFCPENQPIDELLTILRKSKQHLAVVVDEHGAMRGVVTLEDLVEELVGEIYDERDETPEEFMALDKGRILVDGGTELRVVERYFSIELPGKPTDTVSFWLLGHTERIPSVDERFTLDGLEVTVQGATRSRIEQIVLRRLTDKRSASEAAA
jgi:CBS domain containing-hemolysin-like protein